MRLFLRLLLPALVVAAWMAAAGLGGTYFAKLSDVQTEAATDFLPASAESARALELASAFGDQDAPPAILVFEGPPADGIGADARAILSERLDAVRALGGVDGASPLLPSDARTDDGAPLALQAFVAIRGDPTAVTGAVREALTPPPEGVTGYVPGPAGFLADLVEAFGEIDGILLLVTVPAVLVILLLVYRSPLLPLLVLTSALSALAVLPLLFLVQIAFIVAFGVLLDALVVRSFLVPGLLYDVGRGVWWPSALARAAPQRTTPRTQRGA